MQNVQDCDDDGDDGIDLNEADAMRENMWWEVKGKICEESLIELLAESIGFRENNLGGGFGEFKE